MGNTREIVARLWSLCDVLRDDGVTYHQYVTELTYLLFLKMMEETGREKLIPEQYRWGKLAQKEGVAQLTFYRDLLNHLGTEASGRVRDIFTNASTTIRQPKILLKLVTEIDALNWYEAKQEGLGDLYEGLLEKNAGEKKSGAGQYFTPRPLIECMVNVMKPQAGEFIQDPAAGTGGFLIMADRYIKERTDNLFALRTEQQEFQKKKAFYGMELVQDAQRLLLMNAMLHDLEGPLLLGDTLSDDGKKLPAADLILTNPPFGTKKGGGLPSRDDFTFPTSNKQFAFLQHIYRSLKPGGRAAVVLPDNVLFEGNVGRQIREDLMDKCNLHTILRLPTGIFYAQGVKTNVLFFMRGQTDKGNTKEVWVYDLRANMPQFGKRTILMHEHFAEFEAAFGTDPAGGPQSLKKRKDAGKEGRFRRFTREDIVARGDALDIAWLKDDSDASNDDLPEPVDLARAAMHELDCAMEELREILAELVERVDEVEA